MLDSLDHIQQVTKKEGNFRTSPGDQNLENLNNYS